MKRLLALLALLACFLRPAVDDPAPDAPDADPVTEGDEAQPELDLDAPEGEPEPKVEPKEEIESARREAREARESAERYRRELAEERARQHKPAGDDLYDKEEQKLNDSATSDLEKWQIRSNRELRAGRSAAQAALMQAEDVRDQTSFSQYANTQPALHKRYASKVEQELGNARRAGYNPKREAIFKQLIAQDMLDGKFKKKAAPKEPTGKTVNRGRMPGAHSDVSGRAGAMTEHEKRAKRLENVQI